ncbi:MAG: DUF3987 domain-containing protein [Candidatus Obscuribacterales bacterium]|nr:DUF3987 domain-containing protein [Candidatus Obscuribacterales bacterium]
MDRTILTDYTLQGQIQDFAPNDDSTTSGIPEPAKFPCLSPQAMPGWIGNFVTASCENSEADPSAVLFQLLTASAAMSGNSARFYIGDKVHYPRLFTLIYGNSARARKGTSFASVERLIRSTNKRLVPPLRTTTGPLSSGEGLIYNLRDASETVDKKGEVKDSDPGVTDKRLLVIEEEFASALKTIKQEGNTLSTTLRSLWDSGDCEPLTKQNRIKTSGAHVGIIGHITPKDLTKHLSDADVWNGFANRFLFVCARRPQLVALPKPLSDDVVAAASDLLYRAVSIAMDGIELTMHNDAEELWCDIYPELTSERGGIVGVITARAEAHVLRLAAVYAILDQKRTISTEHLRSATSAWQYCLDSARYIFRSTSDVEGEAQQQILEALNKRTMISQSEMHQIFNNHLGGQKINAALAALEGRGAITRLETPPSANGGRKKVSWMLPKKV